MIDHSTDTDSAPIFLWRIAGPDKELYRITVDADILY